MPKTTPLVRRLLDIVRQIDERRRIAKGLAEGLTDIGERADVAILGEAFLLDLLEENLRQAIALVVALADGTRELDAPVLDEIGGLLAAPIWEAASIVTDGVARKADELKRVTGAYEDQIALARSAEATAMEVIKRAEEVRAPVTTESAWLLALRSLFEQASGTLRGRDLVQTAQLLDRLTPEVAKAPEMIRRAQEKYESARVENRQLELLILQSARDAQGRLRYTVLLRTPSEPGTHGVNIQGTSTIVHQDRERIGRMIAELGALVGAEPFPYEKPGVARSMLPRPRATPTDGVGFEKKAGQLGRLLYRLLLPDAMQRYLTENRSSVTITTNDLELPWELMYTDDFLCLKLPVARMPMGNAFPREDRRGVARQGKVRFALVHSDPTGNLPGARAEIETIKENLKTYADQIDVTVHAEVTGAALNELLREGRYDVIHYAGHAWFDEDEPDLSGLVLTDHEVLYAQKIRRLNEGRPLVFLNACSSARVRNEVGGGVYSQLPAEGLASSFIYGGALACIGSVWPVPDQPAAEFATAFYTYVLTGHTIGDALRRARTSLRASHPGDPTWAGFVLYGNPTFTLE